MAGRFYSEAEKAWLVENAPWNCHEDTLDMFEAEFGRRITNSGLRSFMARNGIRVLRSRKIDLFDPEEREWLYEKLPLVTDTDETVREFFEAFPSTSKTPGKVRAWLKNHRVRTNKDTRFKKGQVPHTWVPIGTEKKWADGVWRVKVREPLPDDTNRHAGWVPKAYLVWERANGRPMPDGHLMRYADGDTDNMDPDNLVPVPVEVNGAINSMRIPYSDRESLETAIEIARLSMQAKKACKDAGIWWDKVRREAAT